MLLAIIRMEFHTERHFTRCESGHYIARFGIPQLYVAIIRGRQEIGTPVVPRNILDGLPVTGEGAYAASLAVNLPQFDATVHRSGEQKMSGLGEPADGGDALVVARPGVYVRLGQKAFGRWCIRS